MLLVKWIQINKAIMECQKLNQLMKLKMIKQGEGNVKIKRRNRTIISTPVDSKKCQKLDGVM